jgi:hypothetical protein
MAKDFLGRGWKFPVGVDGRGSISLSEYEQDIKESIWIILSTAKGERVMRPDFGCGIHDLLFASLSLSTLGLVESSVREALARFEPRIDLLGVKASPEEAEAGKLLVHIRYRVRTTNNQFNLVYPFYLQEGR